MKNYKGKAGRRAAAIIAALGLMAGGTGCVSSRKELRASAEQQTAESLRLATTAVTTTELTEEEEHWGEPMAGDTAELRLSESALQTLPDGAEYRVRGKRTEVSLRREGTLLMVRATADSVARLRGWRRIRDQTAATAKADSAATATSRQSAEAVEERRSRSGRSWLWVTMIAAGLGALLAQEWLRDRKRKKRNQ